MSSEMQIALVGVISTLAGTVLGWLLNYLSQKGELNAYIPSFEDLFRYNIDGCMEPSTSIEETEQYVYKIVLDLYNSSAETKAIRDLKIVFSDGENVLFESTPNDDSARKDLGMLSYYDKVAPLNIPPKSVFRLNLHNSYNKCRNEFNLLWETKKVYLVYLDEKNKRKEIEIKKEDYSKYFENHKVEDQ